MRAFFIAGVLLFCSGLVAPALSHAQTLEEVKAQVRAQVKREMGLDKVAEPADARRSERRRTKVRDPGKEQEKVDAKKQPFLEDIDYGEAAFWALVMLILGLIPAIVAKGKGHNFLLWWLYGFVLWIFAVPHSMLLKKGKQKKNKPAEKKNTGDQKEAENDIYEKIEKLAGLRKKGIISEEEYVSKKKELLERI